ncbi:MAG: hypothetical protein RJA81_278 [Planctomycetota bacterium]
MSLGISIVIPVFRGEHTIARLVEHLFGNLGDDLQEIVIVNDDSPDQSDAICRKLVEQYRPKLTYIRLGRNFGEHNAVMAGLTHSRGDFCVIMDDDFQNPPEEVKKLVEFARSGDFDVVYSCYDEKKHSFFRNVGSRFNNLVATLLLEKPNDLYLSSFKCINRWLCQEILKYQGPYPYIDGLILRCTSQIGRVKVRHDARLEGKSGYTLKKLVSLWLRVFLNFSVIPLRISTFIGFSMSFVGLCFGLLTVWEKLNSPQTPVGWASILTTVLVFSGVQMIMLGLLGEYLGRTYLTVNRLPQFSIREVFE